MANNYIQPGHLMDYINPANADPIFSGDVVAFEDAIGVAAVDIGAGEMGAVQLTGVFALPKKTGESIMQGQTVYWDDDAVTATAGAVKAGRVWQTALAGDAAIAVKLVG